MRKSTTFFFIIMLLASMSLYAQRYTVSGTVKDAATGEALIGATVAIPQISAGAMTGSDGSYTIENVPAGTYEFAVSYIGYTKVTKNLKVAGNLTYNFTLENSGILLQETVVSGTRATLRETPVAFSQVSGKQIETELASRDLPMALATTPSVYATLGGGGGGDANMVVRGFDQKNIAVMINGVPVNDMEGKTVYWSNWAGLGDVTEDAQVLRGIGYTPYSVASVGGVVNIITKGIGSIENSAKAKYEMGSNHLSKLSLAFNQKIGKNFSFTGLVSRKTADGYAIGLYYQEWTYYFAVGGIFGNHSLELQFVGSPQEHGQRSSSNSIAKWNQYGKNFNFNVGMLHGQYYNEYVNKYHKPAFNLNWNWQINKGTNLATVFYYSPGRGWGSGYLGKAAPIIASGVNAGLKDYDAVWNTNSTNVDATYSKDQYGTAGLHRTLTANRINWNSHNWFGLVSNFSTALSQTIKLTLGIDGRYYIGMHYQEIRDLLGGDYYVDVYKNGTGGDINNPLKIAKVGDNVGYNYEGHVRQLGGFGQVEYRDGKVSTFVNVSAATVGDQREDFFNYTSNDPLRTSPWVNFTAFTAKTGLNYNFDNNHSAYFNVGYFSTPPTLSNIFIGYNSIAANTQYKNTRNEKVVGLELGYQYTSPIFLVKANAFYTKWQDRAFTFSRYDATTQTTTYTNITGSAQRHQGLELESAVNIARGLELRVTGSLIDAKFQNDVNAIVSNENGAQIGAPVVSYVNGLQVSGFPHQQVSIRLSYRTSIGAGVDFYITPEYRFNGSQYAQFNADNRTNPNDRTQSWKLPDYGMVDLHMGLGWVLTDLTVKKVNVDFHVFNLLDYRDYITYASDGSTHDASSVYVFYGRPRWLDLTLSVGF